MPAKPRSDPFVRAAAAHLPQVEESTWYGTPALKVGGKGFARLKDDETLVVLCPLDEKEMLMSTDPDTFWESPHYSGWPAVLVRFGSPDRKRIENVIRRAWWDRASKAQRAEFGERP